MVRSRVLTLALGVGAILSASSNLSAQHGRRVAVGELAPGAERIVVGSVVRSQAVQQSNDNGDQLIVSQTWVHVDETLKGTPADTLQLDVEGGTLNGITMRVSDMPTLAVGDHVVLFVKRNAAGHYVPHMRGNGILKLGANNVLEDSNVSLDQVRAAVRGAGR
jgi:hypothetical protein